MDVVQSSVTSGYRLALGSWVLIRRHQLWPHLHAADQHLGYSLMSINDSCLTEEYRWHNSRGFKNGGAPSATKSCGHSFIKNCLALLTYCSKWERILLCGR